MSHCKQDSIGFAATLSSFYRRNLVLVELAFLCAILFSVILAAYGIRTHLHVTTAVGVCLSVALELLWLATAAPRLWHSRS